MNLDFNLLIFNTKDIKHPVLETVHTFSVSSSLVKDESLEAIKKLDQQKEKADRELEMLINKMYLNFIFNREHFA